MGFLCSFGIASGKVFRFCSSDIGFLSPGVERQLTYLAHFGILALFVYDLVYFSRQTGSLGPIVLLFFIVPLVYAAMSVFLGFKFVAIWRFLAALRFFLADNPSYLLATPLACGMLYLSGLCLNVLGRSVLLRVFGYGIRFCLWLARLAGCIYGGLRTLAVTLSGTKAFSSIRARLICVTALSWGFACSVLKSLTCWVRSVLRSVNPLAAQVDAQAALILDLQATIADQKASLAAKESAITDMHAMLADKEAAFDDLSVLLRKSNESYEAANESYEAANASLEAANASIVEKDNAIQKVTVTLNGACALAAQRETALVAKCEAVEELEISLQDKVETIGNMAESIRILDLSLAGSREEATRYKRLSEDLQLKLSKRRDENDHLSALLRDTVLSNTHKDEVIDKQAAKMQRMTHQDEEKSCRIVDLEATVSEIKLKLRDTRLANEKQEVQLRAKIDTIDGLKEKVIALEASVDQSRLKALRVERAHSKEIEDALNLQLELQALASKLQSVTAHQAQALEQKDRLIITREDEIAVMSASYDAAVKAHTVCVKNNAKLASAPISTTAEAAVDTADLPTPDAAVLAHTVEQNKALAAQLLHMDAEHTEQILKAQTDLAHARNAVLALRGELDDRDSENFNLKQQLLDARNSRDATSLHSSNSGQSDVLSTNMQECKDIVVSELPASLSWTGAHFSSPRHSTGDLKVADSFDDLLGAMSRVHPTEIDAQPEPSLSPRKTLSVAPTPSASSSFDFKKYLGNMSCELLHDHVSFISQERDSFWLKDAKAEAEVNNDVVIAPEDMPPPPEPLQSSSSLDSVFWSQKGAGECDLLHDKITLGGREDSFWVQSPRSTPAILESPEEKKHCDELEEAALSSSESTSSLDKSFWRRKPECNLLDDDVSLGGDDDSFWLKSDEEDEDKGKDEPASGTGKKEFLPPLSSSETSETSPALEPTAEAEVEVQMEESPCEDMTFRAPLEDTDEPAVKTPASPKRGRSSRVKALKNLEQFVDLPSPLAAPFELPTASVDVESTPISMAKRTERPTASTNVGLSA